MTAPPPIRVLICDDQPLIRTAYGAVFSSQGDLEVVGEARDGAEAVRKSQALNPDVVVMDLHMPVLDGVEATRRLAGPDVDRPVKVLVVTTFNVDHHVYDAFRAGASGFLLKDATPDELLHGLRTVASGDALMAPAVTRRLIGAFGAHVQAPSGHPTDEPAGMGELTERELQVIRLIAQGCSNAEIAEELVLSPETIKTYVSRILSKLGLRDRVHVVIFAFRHGLAAPPA
jgi:DNA-binding NarL/FixJ family response regulator